MTRSPRRVVIVGGGVAGQRCAFALRQRGYDGAVTVVADEALSAYDRPLLSKEYLEGLLDDRDLELEPSQRYKDQDIDVLLGARAVRLDPSERTVMLHDGRELRFDRLVAATGGRARRPLSLIHDRVHVLRSIADARALRNTLASCSSLLVIGGGVLGCEVTATATTLGIQVTLIAAGSTLMGSAFGAQVGERITAMHRHRGAHVRTETFVTGLSGGSDGRPVFRLSDDGAVTADAAVVALGMAPATSWLGTTSTAPVGIETDAFGRTAIADVFAAGDCATWFNPRYGKSMRAEHWEVAAQQGIAVAGSILGDETPFAPLPYFWSNQYDTRLQWIGRAPPWDAVAIEDHIEGAFVARYHHQDRLMAVLAADTPKAIGPAREELSPFDEDEVA